MKKKQKIIYATITLLLITSGSLLYYTEVERARIGYFADGSIIFWNTLAQAIFIGLVSGIIIGKVIKKLSK